MKLNATMLYIGWVAPMLGVATVIAAAHSSWVAAKVASVRTRQWALLITGAALALRMWLAPGGWGDQRATLTSTFDGGPPLEDFGTYGRGIEAVLGPWFRLFDLGPASLEYVGLAFGALAPIALFALLRGLRFSHLMARFASICLALAPLHVRFSPTLNRYVIALTLWCGAVATLLWHLRSTPIKGRSLHLMGVASAVAWACQCRPDMMWLPALIVALTWVTETSKRERRTITLIVTIIAALLLLPASALLSRLGGAEEWYRFTQGSESRTMMRGLLSSDHNLVICSVYTPLAWSVLALWGGFRGLLVVRLRRATLWLLTWAVIATAIVGTSDISEDLLSARYHLLALPAWCALMALGAEGLYLQMHSERLAQAVAATLLILTPWSQLEYTNRVTTQDQEITFLRRVLKDIPDGCTVVAFQPKAQDLGIRPDLQLSLFAKRHHLWTEAWQPQSTHRDVSCAVVYRGSSCDVAFYAPEIAEERRQICNELEQPISMLIAETSLSNDTIGSHRLRTQRVRVSMAWLRRPHSWTRPRSRDNTAPKSHSTR